MTINYNLSGAERKNLVATISEELNTKAKYLGAPSFAYQVGEYTIGKTGVLTGPNNEALAGILESEFTAVSAEYDELAPEEDEAPDATAAATVEASAVTSEDADQLTIEMPLAGFTPETLDNLCKLVTAKEALLKAALDTEELPIQVIDDKVRFPWFNETTSEEAEAYATLISHLCATAKAKKRVTAKAKPIEGSPKYAFRCFLLSLGIIGVEHKVSRRVLLSKLEGNSSWKNGAPPKDETPGAISA
ncbi:MAG: virulence protein [Defluviitaleaceae bacterium]|nr:virulence protein [Defluviitaleaceae bacterium]